MLFIHYSVGGRGSSSLRNDRSYMWAGYDDDDNDDDDDDDDDAFTHSSSRSLILAKRSLLRWWIEEKRREENKGEHVDEGKLWSVNR